MVPIVSIVGKSNSGKTTLIENIIPILKQKGLRVGTIKHDAHHFDIDHEGKDTWRMTKSGADTVVISSEQKMAMIKMVNKEKNIDEMVDWLFKDVDIVITEGYKSGDKPKIEIVRFDKPVTTDKKNLIAVIDNTDGGKLFSLNTSEYMFPIFDFMDKHKIAEFIEDTFLK